MARKLVHFPTTHTTQMVDVTDKLRKIAKAHPSAELMAVYAKGATAAVMIQENWDPNITTDILDLLKKLVPQGVWRHDEVDGNGHSHIKAGLVGTSETIPLQDGEMLLSTWQNVFFCEFDGPRSQRELVVTLLP